MGLGTRDATDQLDLLGARVHDKRARVGTEWAAVDAALYRGGLAPGEYVLLGGRTRTRKTTVTANLIVNMLRGGSAVGLVALDESVEQYTVKVMSAMFGTSAEFIESTWDNSRDLHSTYMRAAKYFTMSDGVRPEFDDLTAWLDMAESRSGRRPQVVFIDYLSLLVRDRYSGAENQRVARLAEDLQVWTRAQQVTTIALTQVGRADDGGSRRYHGDTPLMLEDLKYAGEEMADLVFGTFRPALSKIGNMTQPQAEAYLGDRFNQDSYDQAVASVRRYEHSTMLQLLKNRPGTRTLDAGVELVSHGESQRMYPRLEDDDG